VGVQAMYPLALEKQHQDKVGALLCFPVTQLQAKLATSLSMQANLHVDMEAKSP
jgi:hypothetical protein